MITKEIILTNYEWVSDEAAFLNACIRDSSLIDLLSKCNKLNIIGFTSVDNGMDRENCIGYVEFTFEPEVEMLLMLGQEP
jgi:hypothetical protein